MLLESLLKKVSPVPRIISLHAIVNDNYSCPHKQRPEITILRTRRAFKLQCMTKYVYFADCFTKRAKIHP